MLPKSAPARLITEKLSLGFHFFLHQMPSWHASKLLDNHPIKAQRIQFHGKEEVVSPQSSALLNNLDLLPQKYEALQAMIILSGKDSENQCTHCFFSPIICLINTLTNTFSSNCQLPWRPQRATQSNQPKLTCSNSILMKLSLPCVACSIADNGESMHLESCSLGMNGGIFPHWYFDELMP